jgi:high-affinity iron transporter
MTALSRRSPVRAVFYVSVLGAAIFVIALIIWQGVTAHGTPDPMQPDTNSAVASMDIGILVFREKLECLFLDLHCRGAEIIESLNCVTS